MGPFLCVRTALRLLIMCGILPRYKTLNNVYKGDNNYFYAQTAYQIKVSPLLTKDCVIVCI